MRPSHCTTVTSPTGRLSRRSGISPPSIRLRFTALSMADRLAFPDYNELTTSGTVPFALEVLREFQLSTLLHCWKMAKAVQSDGFHLRRSHNFFVLYRRISVADQNAIARIAVPGNLDDRDGHLLRVHVEFFLHDLGDALHRPSFLLDGATFQHGDLYVRHSPSPAQPSVGASLLRGFEAGEEITQLEAGRVFRVGPVHRVLLDARRPLFADSAFLRLGGIGGTHQRAVISDGVFLFQCYHHNRPARHE